MPSGPPRLLILLPSREVGGAERYVQAVAAVARDRGIAVSAGFAGTAPLAALRRELAAAGIATPVVPFAASEPAGTRAALRQLAIECAVSWSRIVRTRPRGVLVNLPHPDQAPGLVLAAALHRSRTAVVVHLVPDALVISRARRLIYRLARRLGQRWISVSRDSADRLAAALDWPPGAVETIYNGVPIRESDPQARAERRAALRAELGVASDVPVVITVARLSHQKAHDVLLEAIAAVAHPDAVFVWAGDGEDRGALTARARELGVAERVRLLGSRDDVAGLLDAADLFALPSRSEGMPFALLEAMTAGLPAVATALPAIRELIDDGIHGDLVPVEDPGALARALDRLLGEPDRRARLGAAARGRILERHGEAQMIDGVLAALGQRP